MRKEIIKKLKEAGFELVRSNKHGIWCNGERKLSVPHNRMTQNTFKSILQQIENKGPFAGKRNSQIGEGND